MNKLDFKRAYGLCRQHGANVDLPEDVRRLVLRSIIPQRDRLLRLHWLELKVDVDYWNLRQKLFALRFDVNGNYARYDAAGQKINCTYKPRFYA